MSSTLTGVESWSLLALSVTCVGIIANTFHGDGEPLIASLAFSGIAFAFAFSLIRWLGDVFMKANLRGKDMSKIKKVEMYVSEDFITPYVRLMYKTVQKLWELYVPWCIFLQS